MAIGPKRPFREYHASALFWRYGIGAAMVERGAIVPPDGSPRGNGCDSTKGDVSRQGGDGPNPDVLVRFGMIDRALRAIAVPTFREALRLAYGDAGAIVTSTWEHMGRQWRSVAHLTQAAELGAEKWGGKVVTVHVRPVKGEMWDQRERELGGPAPQRFVRWLTKATPRQLGPEGRELAREVEAAAKALLAGAEDAYALSWAEVERGERQTATAATDKAQADGARMAWT